MLTVWEKISVSFTVYLTSIFPRSLLALPKQLKKITIFGVSSSKQFYRAGSLIAFVVTSFSFASTI